MGSFFDRSLPVEVLDNIIRHLSLGPSIARWESFVNPKDVYYLLKSSSSLRDAARMKFHSLALHSYPAWARTRCFDETKGEPGLVLNDPKLLAYLLVALDDVRYLSVENAHRAGLTWIQALERKSGNVVDLSLISVDHKFPLARVLRCCPALKRLMLKFVVGNSHFQHMKIVAQRASGIEALELHDLEPASHADSLAKLWPSFTQLQELAIFSPPYGDFRHNNSLVEALGVGNPNGLSHLNSRLSQLSLGWIRISGLESLAVVCDTLGNRLRGLNVKLVDLDFGHEAACQAALNRIKSACPNVSSRLAFSTKCPRSACAGMEMFKDSLHELSIDDTWSCPPEQDVLHLDASSCTELRSLVLRLSEDNADRFLLSLLPHVGRRLHDFYLTVRRDGVSFDLSLYSEYIARHTGNLQKFVLEYQHKPMRHRRPFGRLIQVAAANPHLKRVVVLAHGNNEVDTMSVNERDLTEKWLVNLVGDFVLNCPGLEAMVVEDRFTWRGGRNGVLGESHSRRRRSTDFTEDRSTPPQSRSFGVDSLSTSLLAKRKVNVRIWDKFYDIMR